MEANERKNANFRFFQPSTHSLFSCCYHVVFSTKFRRKIIGPVLTDELQAIFLQMSTDKPDGFEVIGIGVEADHVHVLLTIPPSLSVSRAVQRIKGVPSRIILNKYPDLEKRIGKRALWQSGYFCRALGDINLPQIKAYLGKQDKEDYFR